jgi:hypothetical protein
VRKALWLKNQPTANTPPTWENYDRDRSNDEDYDKKHTHSQVGFKSTIPEFEH